MPERIVPMTPEEIAEARSHFKDSDTLRFLSGIEGEDNISLVELAEGENGDGKKVYKATASKENWISRYNYNGYSYRLKKIHSLDAIDFSEWQRTGMIFWVHDSKETIGKLEKFDLNLGNKSIDIEFTLFDGVARASEVAHMIAQKGVKDVSIGIDVLEDEWERKETSEGKVEISRTITKWRPIELSIVPIGANKNTRLKLGLCYNEDSNEDYSQPEPQENHMPEPTPNPEPTKIETTLSAAMTKEDLAAAIVQAREEGAKEGATKGAAEALENKKFKDDELRAAASLVNGLPEKDKYSILLECQKTDKSIAEFGALCDAKLKENSKGGVNPNTELGLSAKEIQKFSISKVLRVLSGIDKELDGVEFEASTELMKKKEKVQSNGETARFAIPYDVLSTTRFLNGRKLVLNSEQAMEQFAPITSTTANRLVGTQHMPSSYIENLRDKAKVLSAGVEMITGLTGNIDIPRKTNSAIYTFRALAANTVDTALTFDQITMSLKTASASVSFSRDLVIRGEPAIEGIIYSDLSHGAALLIDDTLLEADGTSNAPTGIASTTGISTLTASLAIGGTAGRAYSHADLVTFEETLAADNALMGNEVFFATSTDIKHLKTIPITTGYPIFPIPINNMLGGMNYTVNGYRMMLKTQGITNGNMFFGNFSDALLGVWGMLELMRDTATFAQSGGVAIRSFVDIDVAIRHPESFCLGSYA